MGNVKPDILTEYQEQCLLVQYLEAKKIKFSKIAQETFTRDWGTKMKNKLSGLRPGLPDMLIILPKKLLFIEMKRTKGGSVKPDQKEWIEELNKIDNVYAFVAKGYEEAKKIIESLC